MIAKKKYKKNNGPQSVRFSPDGLKIAVGFYYTRNIDILSGNDLAYLYSPITENINNGDLGSVAWSKNDKYLYGAGRWYDIKGIFQIRRWSNEGEGEYIDLSGPKNAIMDILPLNDSGVMYGSFDPAFGVFDKNGNIKIYKASFIPDFRFNLNGFLISSDASIIQFGFESYGKSPARFSTKERILINNPKSNTDLSPPITTGLRITEWDKYRTPKLNGKILKLEKDEGSRCLAISHVGNSFLLGTDWYLRLFDSNGNERMKIPTPSVTLSVNISGNNKVAIAAFGNGTIRWYRLSDLTELLAFFPHNDKKRWVIWTQSGYYDVSPGGDDLIGWHVNNGIDKAADFFPISMFRSEYYRPDIIEKILDTLDEKEAIRIANEESGRKKEDIIPVKKMLPPVVKIIYPPDGAVIVDKDVVIEFMITPKSDESIKSIIAYVNRTLVMQKYDINPLGNANEEISITIPKQDCEVSIIAENRSNIASEPATIKLKYQGEKKEEKSKIKTLYVLAVGIENYSDSSLKLDYAVDDAEDFSDTILKQKGKLYDDVQVKIIRDGKRTQIIDGFQWIIDESKEGDTVMCFLSGHGFNEVRNFYFLPVDGNKDKLRSTGIKDTEIKDSLIEIKCTTILFIDACHSGNAIGKADITGLANDLRNAKNGIIVFTSSSGNQKSYEDKEWKNGAFTKALVEGINGEAAKNGEITVDGLSAYVTRSVKDITVEKQTPTSSKPNGFIDFTIAVINK